MNIRIECPKCKSQYDVPDKHLGKEVDCPKCKTTFTCKNNKIPSSELTPVKQKKKISGCLIILIFFIFLVCLSLFFRFQTQSKIARANTLWSENQKEEAIRIYIDNLLYVDNTDKPELYSRIIAYRYDKGDKNGATEYCNNAIAENIDLQFSRDDLQNLLNNARQSFKERKAKELAEARAKREAEAQAKKEAEMKRQAEEKDKVKVKIVNDKPYYDYKRSVDVILSRKVSQKELAALAHKIKSKDGRKYERTFISYYLPDMKIDAGAWATTHFNPDLEVKVLGLSLEDEEKMEEMRKNKKVNPDEEILGCWLDTEVMGLEHDATVFKKNGVYCIRKTYKDGSESTNECLNRKENGILYLKSKGSNVEDYYAIDANGDFWHSDKDKELWGKGKKSNESI